MRSIIIDGYEDYSIREDGNVINNMTTFPVRMKLEGGKHYVILYNGDACKYTCVEDLMCKYYNREE